MGKPQYVFAPREEGGEVVVYMMMLPEPPPTPEKFQRKARIRRLRQQWQKWELTNEELEAAIQQVEDDYTKGLVVKP